MVLVFCENVRYPKIYFTIWIYLYPSNHINCRRGEFIFNFSLRKIFVYILRYEKKKKKTTAAFVDAGQKDAATPETFSVHVFTFFRTINSNKRFIGNNIKSRPHLSYITTYQNKRINFARKIFIVSLVAST